MDVCSLDWAALVQQAKRMIAPFQQGWYQGKCENKNEINYNYIDHEALGTAH